MSDTSYQSERAASVRLEAAYVDLAAAQERHKAAVAEKELAQLKLEKYRETL